MKKLYVLVFLIMFMGKIFCSQSPDPRNYVDLRGDFKFGKDSVQITDKTLINDNPYYISLVIKYLELYKTDLLNISKFLEASNINSDLIRRSRVAPAEPYSNDVVLNIESKMLKDNPWDTIASKALADKYDLKESDLKSMGISNWARESILGGKPLTLEERFMLRLQKALVEKIRGMTDAKDIIEPLKALLSANDKRPADFGKKTITEILNVVRPDLQPAVIEAIKSAASKNFSESKIALEEAKKDLDTKLGDKLSAIANAEISAKDKKLSRFITTYPSDPIPADVQRQFYEQIDKEKQDVLKITTAEHSKSLKAHEAAVATHDAAQKTHTEAMSAYVNASATKKLEPHQVHFE